MRKFLLINSLGQKWDLTSNNSFIDSPSGLGFKKKSTFFQVGSEFLILDEKMEQKSIKGTMIFKTYEDYHKFTLFIQHKPLTLQYILPTGIFGIKTTVASLDKGEKDVTKLLKCTIEFSGLSAFYKTVISENADTGDVGKTYPYNYAYTYTNFAKGTVTIDSESVMDGSAKITILGPCKNPSWTHYLNGVIKTTGKVKCEIDEGNRLIVDNTKIPYEIAEYDSYGNFVQNLYQASDFSTQRFINIGFGSNEIAFSHEGTTPIVLIVEGIINYESV